MTEPASAAIGAALGVGIMAALGIEPAPLFGALVGSCIGLSFAGPTGRARAAVVFLAVTLCCSLFGPWLAVRYLGGDPASRSVAACGLGIWFHPVLNLAIDRLPRALDAWLDKIGAGG